jgi:hypothetical protein
MPYKDPEKQKAYDKEYQKKWAKHNPEKRRMYRRNWSKKHPEKLKEYDKRKCQKIPIEVRRERSRKHYATHSEQINSYQREYYSSPEQKEKGKAYRKERNITHKEKNNAYERKHRQEQKQIAIAHYSNGTMKCAWCEYNDIRALTIDHLTGEGSKHRKENSKAASSIYRYLITQSFPPGYQVLCMVCQNKKEVINRTIKNSANQNKSAVRAREYKKKLKYKVFSYYSNNYLQCNRCGLIGIDNLTLDHINGYGTRHRKATSKTAGHIFYNWIIKNNYPNGFQLLCWNCQLIKRDENREMYLI